MLPLMCLCQHAGLPYSKSSAQTRLVYVLPAVRLLFASVREEFDSGCYKLYTFLTWESEHLGLRWYALEIG